MRINSFNLKHLFFIYFQLSWAEKETVPKVFFCVWPIIIRNSWSGFRSSKYSRTFIGRFWKYCKGISLFLSIKFCCQYAYFSFIIFLYSCGLPLSGEDTVTWRWAHDGGGWLVPSENYYYYIFRLSFHQIEMMKCCR